MRIRFGASSIAVVAIATMSMVAFSPLASTASAHVATEKSTCRGSAARIELGGGTLLEPIVVGNAPGQKCTAQSKTLIGPINLPGLVSIAVGNASTAVSGTVNHPTTTAQVAGTSVSVLGLITIGADVINAKTNAGNCSAGIGPTSKPILTSSGLVANLVINGQPIVVGPGPVSIDVLNLGLVFLDLNKVTTSAYSITRQAFVLSVPLLGLKVVLAEAQAGFVGHPCDAL